MQNFLQDLIPWFLSHGVKIVFILIVAFLVNQFLKIFVKKAVRKMIGDDMEESKRKRTETLISIFGGTLSFAVSIIALLMIFSEFGVNIGPLLAGAGLIGLAVGMASKEIVSDFLSGLFIILEDQYRVGDEIKIAGVEGKVLEITLRRTIIKDEGGLVHSIANGQIKTVAKRT